MSYYCQNCGALNARDRARCSACFQSLEEAKSTPPLERIPPWSQTPKSLSHKDYPVSSQSGVSRSQSGSSRPASGFAETHMLSAVSQNAQVSPHQTPSFERSISGIPPSSPPPTPRASYPRLTGQEGDRVSKPWSIRSDALSHSPQGQSQDMGSEAQADLASVASQKPSRTLAPERLAQLFETPQVFIFGGGQELEDHLSNRPKMAERVRDLIKFCEPLLTTQVKEASIFLAFELPPRSWLQALNELRPDGEILIWLSQWPEGKTGTQLAEGRTSAFFYGQEGLIELAVTLYRLAPFSTEERPHDQWWSEVHLRASLVEVEHFQRLLTQPEIDHYLVTLFAQRMRRWARVAQDPLWIRLAQSSQQLSNYLANGQHQLSALQFGAPTGASVEEVFYVAEELLCHELLSRGVTHRSRIEVACVTTLKTDHPELGDLLTRFGAEVTWFKHPQALLERINERYFHWVFLSEHIGPWDGFDLAQEARHRAAHLKISISVFSRRTHVLARAEHLKIDLLLYPSDPTSYQVISLNRALNSKSFHQSEGQSGLYKRLDVIQEAQLRQGLAQRTGLLLLHTGTEDPWLPQWIHQLEDLRTQYMPKSLASISLDEHTLAFPLALDQEEPIKQFLAQSRAQIHQKLTAGAILNQGPRAPESAVADALLRLDWSRLHQLDLTLGWWRGGIETEGGLGAHGAQLLIVDADPTSVDLLRYFSERAGLLVNTLTSGKSAIELLERLQYPPQLIIVECTLPYVDGFQVLQVCRELERSRPRVIMTSAIKRDDLIERAFQNGASDFIYKPYNMAEVMARVIHALS